MMLLVSLVTLEEIDTFYRQYMHKMSISITKILENIVA
jgi:hypothetical protein